MSVDALCQVKTLEEKGNVEEILFYYLSKHAYFKTVLKDISDAEKKELVVLLNNKGYFCYDFMTSNDRLLVITFPELCDFYNKLTKSEPNPERYAQSKRVWDLLKCRNLDDFWCLYNVLDSLKFLQDLHNLSVNVVIST